MQTARRNILREVSGFSVSTLISNSASPLNIISPGQGLKSGGNLCLGVASTIQFLTADANKDPKDLSDL
jgi:hypothetical protein